MASYEYGGRAGSNTEGLVWVSTLQDLASYNRVMTLLSDVEEVATVYPRSVDDSGTVFAVMPRSALVAVEQAMIQSGDFRRTAPPATKENSPARFADVAVDYLRR